MRAFILGRASLACAAMFFAATVRAQELYVSSTFNDQIDEVNPNGSISGFATLPGAGSGREACGISLGPNGDLYGFDYGYPSTVVQVTPGGVTSTIGTTNGDTSQYIAVGANGDIYMPGNIPNTQQGVIYQMTPSGTTSVFANVGNDILSTGIAAGPGGDLYELDDEHGSILKITPAGVVSTFLSGLLSGPPAGDISGIAVDSSGDVYYGQSSYTFLSSGDGYQLNVDMNEVNQDGALISGATLPTPNVPSSIAIGPNGSAFLSYDSDIYRYASGNVSLYATLTNGDKAFGLAYDAAAVPEPSMAVCLALGLSGLALRRRKSC